MLKSTYKPSAAAVAANGPLEAGWTEHKAPTGHTYYYNAATKVSTYKRPVAQPQHPIQPVQPAAPAVQYPTIATPAAANAFMAKVNPNHFPTKPQRNDQNNDKPRPKPQPIDKPRSRVVIPGHEGWFLVNTKYGRRFVYNAVKDASFWRIPDKLKGAIAELDRREARRKAGIIDPEPEPETQQDDDEYEEVEVTDDEDQEGGEHSHKRQRVEEEEANDGPVEFTEDDFMAQLAAMQGGYEGEEDAGEDAEDDDMLTLEDAQALFKDLLTDFRIGPYSPWETVVSNTQLVEDPRYLALATTRERKECWDAWSKEQIAINKARKATEEKADPKLAYVALLSEKASTKLFWPEFKRKFRKEPIMGDRGLSDKEREKMYREYVARLKLPSSQLKSDLAAFLKTLPLTVLNNHSNVSQLPPVIRGDVRFAAVPASIRDPLVGAVIQSLPGPPSTGEDADETPEENHKKEARRKREAALETHARRAEETKAKQRQ